MSASRRVLLILAFVGLVPLLAATLPQPASTAQKGQDALFLNLTSADSWRAGMALNFTLNAQKAGHPVTVFLNVEGVRLASRAADKASQDLLRQILEGGGRLIVCPMCMKKAGITAEELIEGAEVGSPDKTLPALFAPNGRVMSY